MSDDLKAFPASAFYTDEGKLRIGPTEKLELACTKISLCMDCGLLTGLLATDICITCYTKNEETVIETKNNCEPQELDYVCRFYEQRRD